MRKGQGGLVDLLSLEFFKTVLWAVQRLGGGCILVDQWDSLSMVSYPRVIIM